jgi:hypothetical protein
MIKSGELRIGNLVLHKGNVIKVDSILFNGINAYCAYGTFHGHPEVDLVPDILTEDIHGIPITEEWIARLGLKNHGNIEKANYCIFNEFITEDGKFLFVVSCHVNEFGEWGYHAIRVDFVHQLQNLHFSLTGKELELGQTL